MTPPNRPPTADPQQLTTPEDVPLALTLTGADPDGDPITYTIVDPPAHGALIGIAPVLTYEPAPDFNGSDQFTFKTNDAAHASQLATVEITVTEVNDPPIANPDDFQVGENESSEIPAAAMLTNDLAGPANESGQTLRVAAVGANAATHGTVSVADGTVTYVPDPGYSGPASFTYTLCDDGTTNGHPDPLCVSDGVVTLTVVAPDRPPTADPQDLTTPEDVPLPLTLTGGDPDGDSITYTIVDPPQHGTLIGVAPALTFEPAPDFNGSDQFTFKTNDGRADSELATVAIGITEVNDPPVLGPDSFTLGGAGTLTPPPTKPVCSDPCGVMWGDPHNVTFDHGTYDFQGVGEFVAVKSTVDDFELQIRTAPYPRQRHVSLATAVAMRVNQHRVGLYRTSTGTRALVDGAPITVPATPLALPGGGSIGTYGSASDITVVWPDGSLAIFTAAGLGGFPYFSTKVSLAAGRRTHMIGLLGNADGTATNDLVTRDGRQLTFPHPVFGDLYPGYADSWRVSQAESLFDYGTGETTDTFTDRTFPDAPVTPADLPADVRAAATAQCNAAGVVLPDLLDACVVDVGVTGDPSFADDAASTQSATFGTTLGAPTTVTIANPGDTAARTFTATAGQLATLSLTGNTIATVDVTITQPNGTFVGSLTLSAAAGFHDVMTFPVTGTYTITVDPRDQNTGSLTFELDNVPVNTGTAAIGVASTVTIGTVGENAVRSFTAAAGEQVTLSVTGNTIPVVDVTIRQPNGTFVGSTTVSSASAFHDVMTLPVAGTYTVTVDPRDQNIGSLTFALNDVPSNTSTASIGTPATVSIGTVGENAVRSFTATAGQLVTLSVSANTIPVADVTIRQPNGTFVGSITASSATGFHDVMTLPVTGTYTVTVDPRDQNVGSLTFLLSSVPQNTGTTAIGQATTVTIGTVGENAVRSFTATAGELVTLSVSGNTIPVADVTIRQPNGNFVGSITASSATGFHDVMTLPVAGTYTVTVDPRDQNTGSLTFSLNDVPLNTGTTSIGVPTSVTIGTVGENAVRSFTATAGQLVTLSVSGNTIPVADVTVRQPNGSFVGSITVSSATVFHDVMTLPVAGTYTVTVDPRDQNIGSLTFSLNDVPVNTGTATIGASTSVTIGTVGENAVRSFTATAGQLVTLSVSGNTIPVADVTIRQPNGNFVGSITVSSATGFHDVMTLPVAGTYTITIDPRDQNTGSLTFELDAVTANTGTTAIGQPTTVTIGMPSENALRSFSGVAGQRVTLLVSGNTVPLAQVDVHAPDGSSLGSVLVSGGTAFGKTMTLPARGRYTVTVDPLGRSVGRLRFAIGKASAGKLARRARAMSAAPKSTPAAVQATDPVRLTLTTDEVLANDRPGPANESVQTLAIVAVNTSAASHGTATLDGDTITYTPAAGFSGPASFTYTACDNGTTNGQPDPRCSIGTISVKVTVNHPPTAAPQQVTTAEDTPAAITLGGADADGDAVNFTIEQEPSHGTLTGTAPNVTYVPAPNFHGTDSFAFSTDDTHDRSAPATVGITVSEVNDKPVPQPDSVTGAPGQPVTVAATQLASNDSPGPFDENGQKLTVTAVAATADTHGTVALAGGNVTYTPAGGFAGTASMTYTVCDDGTTAGQPDPQCADGRLTVVTNLPPQATAQSTATTRDTPTPITFAASDPEGDTLTFAVATQPAHGVVTGTAPDVVYTPAPGFTGSDSFTFTASDSYSTSAPAVVSIDVTATTPPTIRPDIVATSTNVSVLVDVLANDSAAAGALDPATLAVVVAPTSGTAVVEGAAIRYTPALGVIPDDHFTYRVCDTLGICGTAEVTVTVTVPNRPPVAKADSYQVDEGATLSPAAPGVLANDSDPDPGDTIQARLGTGVSAGNLLLRSNGSFTYTPAAGFAGSDSFTYFVVDRAGLASAAVTVSIEVIPPGPLAVDDAYTTTRDNPLTVMPATGLLANDRDAHSTGILTAALNRGAPHGNVDVNPDGSFVYTPDPGFVGTDSFLYVATDLPGLVSAPAHVAITVNAPAGPVPTVSGAAPADGTRVTAPTPITAQITPPAGETISQWTVTALNCDRGTPVVLASGAGSPPSPLATFDPTTMANGCYQIQIGVTSSGGGVTTAVSSVVVAGEMKLGDYATTYKDLSTTIAGFPIDVTRTYDTTDSRQGDFGVGWRVDLSSFRVTPNNRLGQGGWSTQPFGFPFTRYRFVSSKSHFVTVTEPGGRVEVFDFVPDPSGPLLTLTLPGFVARPGTGTTSTLQDVDSPTLSLAGDSMASFFGGELYDPRLFRLTTADGNVLIIDRFNGLQSITDRNGNQLLVDGTGIHSPSTSRQLTFTRDGAGRITSIDAPGGKHTSYTYSAVGDLSTFTDAGGNVDKFTYNGAHRLLAVDGPNNTRLRTLTYGPDGRFTSLTDAAGNTMSLSSNVDTRSEVVTTPSGRLTTLTSYGADGNVATKEEAFSGHTRVTQYAYDTEGNLTKTTSPLGRVEILTYDAAGNITSRTTPKGEKWLYAFNALNEPTTTTAPDGTVVESRIYDGNGNVMSSTTSDGRTVTLTHDNNGLPTSATDAFGTTTFGYDANEQLVTQTDPAGGITRTSYDDAGRVSSIDDPAGHLTQFKRNALDQLVEVTAPDGSKQTAAYDAFGRLTALTDSAGRTTTYRYDAADQLVARVDRAGLTTTYGYDQDGNLSTVTYPDGDVATSVWDPVGRQVSLSDGDTIVDQTYDDANDLLAERSRGTGGVALPDVTLSYTTDANGNRTSVTGPGGVVNYAYDSRGRLSSVRDGAGRAFALTYDSSSNRLTGLARPNGVNDVLSYQGDVLTARDASSGAQVIGRADYVLDSLRQRTSLTDVDGAHTFTHDAAGQLTAAVHPAGSGLADESFQYDSTGNRTAWAGSPAATVGYDAGGRLQSDGTYDYTYDAEGRLLTRLNRATGGVTRYAWNGAGQLASVTAPNGAVSSYRYDGFGRRVEANDDGTIRRFVYSGGNLIAAYDGTNSLRTTYVTGTALNSVYEIIRAGTPYYPLFDAVGSVTALTDGSGAVAGRVRYSAFGAPTSSGVADDGFMFTGQQYDTATGLVYARARYYDPTLGRFVSQDPDPSVNPYEYAFNAPLEFTDPTGRAGLIERIKVMLGLSPSAGYLLSQAQRDERIRQAEAKAAQAAADAAVTLLKTWETPISDIWKSGGGGG